MDELCSDDFIMSYPNHGPRHGKEGAKKMLSEFMQVIHYIIYSIHHIMVQIRKWQQKLTAAPKKIGISRLDI